VPIAERVIEFKGMMVINDVAAGIWEFLKQDRTYEQIVDHVCSVYEVDRKTAEKDIKELIQQMKDSGVLENGQ
jgi:hypothetical protein